MPQCMSSMEDMQCIFFVRYRDCEKFFVMSARHAMYVRYGARVIYGLVCNRCIAFAYVLCDLCASCVLCGLWDGELYRTVQYVLHVCCVCRDHASMLFM